MIYQWNDLIKIVINFPLLDILKSELDTFRKEILQFKQDEHISLIAKFIPGVILEDCNDPVYPSVVQRKLFSGWSVPLHYTKGLFL